jgi:hypothetical protein
MTMLFGTTAIQRTQQGALDVAAVTLTQYEMILAAAAVIGARMTIAALVQQAPLSVAASDASELHCIVPEKMHALSEAGAAVLAEWRRLDREIGEYLLYLGRTMISARPPAPADVLEFAERTTAHGALLAGSVAAVGLAAITPVHSTVTRNARRLARRR